MWALYKSTAYTLNKFNQLSITVEEFILNNLQSLLSLYNKKPGKTKGDDGQLSPVYKAFALIRAFSIQSHLNHYHRAIKS